MWLIRFILNLFKGEDIPEVKSNSIGTFTKKLNQSKSLEKNNNTWTGPYRKR